MSQSDQMKSSRKKKNQLHRHDLVPRKYKKLEADSGDSGEELEQAYRTGYETGFHSSGKYYTMYEISDVRGCKETDSILIVHRFSKRLKELKWKLIRMKTQDERSLVFRQYYRDQMSSAFYHHPTSRWFLFEKKGSKATIVHSGCLSHLFDEPGKVIEKFYEETQDTSIELSCPVGFQNYQVVTGCLWR